MSYIEVTYVGIGLFITAVLGGIGYYLATRNREGDESEWS